MNKGICSITFRKMTPAEIITLCAENHADAIEWGSDVHVPAGETDLAREISIECLRNGIKCPSYGTYYNCDDSSDFAPFCETAAALDAKTVRVWAGTKERSVMTAEEYKETVRTIKNCAKTAQSYNLNIAFEYHHGTLTSTPESTLRLLDDVQGNNVFTYWQPMYWLNTDKNTEIEENLRSIDLLRNHIINVHVYNWEGTNRLPLASAKAEWENYMRHLNADNYYLEFVQYDAPESFVRDYNQFRLFAPGCPESSAESGKSYRPF